MSPPAIGRRAAVGSAAASDWSSYSGCSVVESEVEHGSSWASPASPSWRALGVVGALADHVEEGLHGGSARGVLSQVRVHAGEAMTRSFGPAVHY